MCADEAAEVSHPSAFRQWRYCDRQTTRGPAALLITLNKNWHAGRHEAVLEAVRTADPDKAATAMEAHSSGSQRPSLRRELISRLPAAQSPQCRVISLYIAGVRETSVVEVEIRLYGRSARGCRGNRLEPAVGGRCRRPLHVIPADRPLGP
jgi:hypothetical protein